MRAQQVPVFRRRQNARRGRDAAQGAPTTAPVAASSYGICRSGVSYMSGICTASTPPGARNDSSRGNSSRVPVHPVQRGIRVDQIERLRPAATGRSPPARTGTAGTVARAFSSIAAEPSTPITSAVGKALPQDGRDIARHRSRDPPRAPAPRAAPAPADPAPGAAARRRIADIAPDPRPPRTAPSQCRVRSRRSKCRLMNRRRRSPRRRTVRGPARDRALATRRGEQQPDDAGTAGQREHQPLPDRHAPFLPGSVALASYTSADRRGRNALSVRRGLDRLLRFGQAQGEAERGAGRARSRPARCRRHAPPSDRGRSPARARCRRAARCRQTDGTDRRAPPPAGRDRHRRSRPRASGCRGAPRCARSAHLPPPHCAAGWSARGTTGCGPPAPGSPGRRR